MREKGEKKRTMTSEVGLKGMGGGVVPGKQTLGRERAERGSRRVEGGDVKAVQAGRHQAHRGGQQ